MLRFVLLCTLPVLVYSSVQCYVGQKLFSYESNNAICARLIPYTCTTQCEWKKSCSEHAAYTAFRGRRTFVSGLLINAKSLMVLCCASLSTRVETDSNGGDKCVWRDTESLPVFGPSIRTNPVLAPNHYIRDVKMERDGTSRVEVAIEVCQYVTELEHCNVNNMTENEKRRLNVVQLKLQRSKETPTSNLQKTHDDDKNTAVATEGKAASTSSSLCQVNAMTECGHSIQSQISTCCKDQTSCDRGCLKNVEGFLNNELAHHQKGCSVSEVQQALDCLGKKVNNLSL